MPTLRSSITASSKSIPRTSGTSVPGGIDAAGGEANVSPGSGPDGLVEPRISVWPPGWIVVGRRIGATRPDVQAAAVTTVAAKITVDLSPIPPRAAPDGNLIVADCRPLPEDALMSPMPLRY